MTKEEVVNVMEKKQKHQEKVCRNCTHLLKVFAREDMWYECFLMNSDKYNAPTVELDYSCKMFKKWKGGAV